MFCINIKNIHFKMSESQFTIELMLIVYIRKIERSQEF